MQIAHDYANYSLGEADVLRRAISKKKKKYLMKKEKSLFQDALIKMRQIKYMIILLSSHHMVSIRATQ